jgi:hypothetical protein
MNITAPPVSPSSGGESVVNSNAEMGLAIFVGLVIVWGLLVMTAITYDTWVA